MEISAGHLSQGYLLSQPVFTSIADAPNEVQVPGLCRIIKLYKEWLYWNHGCQNKWNIIYDV